MTPLTELGRSDSRESCAEQIEMPVSPNESEEPAHPERKRLPPLLRYLFWSSLALAVLVASLLCWGGYLLVSDDPLPPRVDGAVVLQGSVLGERARTAGAMRLVQQGTTARILISIPKETDWGQPVAPVAYAYLERTYGAEAASHVDFCETLDVDSTEEEAKALADCLDKRAWHSIVVVTSDYHTRRAGMIWRTILRQHPTIQLWMHGVPDPEFNASGWWRERRSAKTWVMEFTKLSWKLCGGD